MKQQQNILPLPHHAESRVIWQLCYGLSCPRTFQMLSQRNWIFTNERVLPITTIFVYWLWAVWSLECLLLFSAESFVFQAAIQKYKQL